MIAEWLEHAHLARLEAWLHDFSRRSKSMVRTISVLVFVKRVGGTL